MVPGERSKACETFHKLLACLTMTHNQFLVNPLFGSAERGPGGSSDGRAGLPLQRPTGWIRSRICVFMTQICGDAPRVASRHVSHGTAKTPTVLPMPNRLAAATSPYLLQHQNNPVDWHEWGPAAFELAREQDRPILLSVGYSACHWCHVMAHESFEHDATAAVMNRLFVNVKVDREERPDVDRIYMDAVQAMTGRGGWPMTVFLTPEGRPFFAGTYFPREDRPNQPSFGRVMAAVTEAWTNRRDEVEAQAGQLTAAVQGTIAAAAEPPADHVFEGAYSSVHASWDRTHGGFGGAPKFPQAPTLEFLLRIADEPWASDASAMLEETLLAMARGGIYDHVAGGFARYSVDAHWLVPHFEKMLYDNALLARIYLRAWQVLGHDRLRTVAVETLDYLLRDLALPGGGFASAEDADSEGVEGKFYVFGSAEFLDLAGAADGPIARDYFGVSEPGNFEGANILFEAVSVEDVASKHGIDEATARTAIDRVRAALAEARARRVRPALDDKVVTAWNGLTLRALAEAGAILGSDRYLEAARANARFVLSELRRPDGRLMRSWREGRATVPAFLEDHAAYAIGLLALFQATGEVEWYREAVALVAAIRHLFADPDGDGFFTSGTDVERLIARPKDLFDNPTPSGNSLAAEALFQLSLYTGDAGTRQDADGVLRLAGRLLESYPQAVGHLLAVAASSRIGAKEVAVIGAPEDPRTQQLLEVVWARFLPGCALAVDPGDGSAAAEIELLTGRVPHAGPPVAYVCRDFVCRAPTSEPVELARLLAER